MGINYKKTLFSYNKYGFEKRKKSFKPCLDIRNLILSTFADVKVNTNLNTPNLGVYYIPILNTSFTITDCYDDYYYVELEEGYNIIKYKCDQLDGIKELFNFIKYCFNYDVEYEKIIDIESKINKLTSNLSYMTPDGKLYFNLCSDISKLENKLPQIYRKFFNIIDVLKVYE